MTTLGIVGGTGPAGQGVALRVAGSGVNVTIGSRTRDRAIECASELSPRGSGHIVGASNEDAARCDVVVVATPWDSAVATVKGLKEELAGKVVISMVNALVKEGREMLPLYPPRGSMAAQIQAQLPQSRVVGAFHHLPAGQMLDLDSGLEADVIVFGDDGEARRMVCEMIDAMVGLRSIDAGSLSLASAVEAFTAVCISINIRHRVHSSVRMVGFHH